MTSPILVSSIVSGSKAPTGIAGFDQITKGGLPRGRSTLLTGGPGSGKTIFSTQFLVHGSRECGEPGIFVCMEESSNHIVANLEGFGWKLGKMRQDELFFLNAQPMPDLSQSGSFDLSGMLAALEAKATEIGARRIVFDALDVVLALLPDPAARRLEMQRVHLWLLNHELTALITAKASDKEISFGIDHPSGFLQYTVDCSVVLNHRVDMGVSQRSLRVQKFRGSSFVEDESPFVIGNDGFDVAISRTPDQPEPRVTLERVSSGVDRLDTMLGGGYFRGSSVLITGFPGTAKTTLSGAFAEAACGRGEPTMFISFDSDGSEVVRNLTSVGIQLQRYQDNGCLQMVSARTFTGSAETLMVRIKSLATQHKAICLVIDPVSTLSKMGNERTAHSVAERLIDWAKSDGITLICTSLLDDSANQTNGNTPLQISTLADTWIHLNYLVQAGERNRGLSLIKSRGTFHSNQVREMILSSAGVALTDIYTADGEVLMGTMRWQKESTERLAEELAQVAGIVKGTTLDAEMALLEVRLKSLQTELVAKRSEKDLLNRTLESRAREISTQLRRTQELRSADASESRQK